jgi:hypothetical protein
MEDTILNTLDDVGAITFTVLTSRLTTPPFADRLNPFLVGLSRAGVELVGRPACVDMRLT